MDALEQKVSGEELKEVKMKYVSCQMEFHGPGQGMGQDWYLSAYNWGRLSRGATVRLGGLGEVTRFVLSHEMVLLF